MPAFREIGVARQQLCGGRSNNRCENSHLPFRRRERAMQKFKSCAMLQKFTSYHAQIYNHFNHERHLENRQTYKQKRTTALTEWFNFCADSAVQWVLNRMLPIAATLVLPRLFIGSGYFFARMLCTWLMSASALRLVMPNSLRNRSRSAFSV